MNLEELFEIQVGVVASHVPCLVLVGSCMSGLILPRCCESHCRDWRMSSQEKIQLDLSFQGAKIQEKENK